MDLYAEIDRLQKEGRAFVLATVVQTAGSTPQKPGSKMIVLPDGSPRGTVGGGAIEQQILEAARELLASSELSRLMQTHLTHDLGMCCGGRMTVFLEKHAPAARLYVFGAGHVGTELAAFAQRTGFVVTVVDERADWARPERFPAGITVLRAEPVALARSLEGGPDHYFCISTHDHPLDQALVEALLRTRSAYLGVIGSRRKAERFGHRLEAAGFSAEERARLRSPMGVPIRALTPAEIAVSIVAELISIRRAEAPGP
jgi:xanthine dehydrogenase accessory factor